jgi:hypothetical protein
MCCFSQPVQLVSNTNIFGRATGRGTQVLAYAMSVGASEDMAMVLPIPSPAQSPEDAVRFVNLEGYPRFFDDMRSGFPEMMLVAGFAPQAAAPAARLAVHDVGAFEASFVPTQGDFARLDPRFVLSPRVWDNLPGYRDWGFAVFKLKGFAGSTRPSTRTDFHPMAFEFSTRYPNHVFFPTVHVHDGQVHSTATFDHALYCQVSPAAGEDLLARTRPEPFAIPGTPPRQVPEWERSVQPAGGFIQAGSALGLVDANAVVYRRLIAGPAPNGDHWAPS